MSKSWNPGRQTVALRPSRIRREPPRLPNAAPPRRSRESEMRAAVIGVALVAIACVAIIVGVIEVTSQGKAAPEPVRSAFGNCQTAGRANCVVDGRTFRIDDQLVTIAGIDAPKIHGSRCSTETQLGIAAAMRLRELLNRGTVVLSPNAAGAVDDTARKVEVNGRDIGAILVASGVAREQRAEPHDWCRTSRQG